jgi:SAM-dependent methyltransferase
MSAEHPLPPLELMQRVGRVADADIGAAYEAIGRASRERIERLLPDDWSWDGKRVLDFGCGAGRTLRHFLSEAERAEFYGCDIDAESIAWLGDHLSPPLLVFQSGETPSLPQPDDFFDLIYALSVFTHISDHWSGWLLELHRVLHPTGLLFATFLNEPMWAEFGRGVWNEERTGMLVTKKWNPWDSGGPIVFHSEWWLREHWGRAFDVLRLERTDADGSGQGAVLLQAKPVQLSRKELGQPADDPREFSSLAANLEHVHAEAADQHAQIDAVKQAHRQLVVDLEWTQREHERHRRMVERLQSEVERLHAELARISNSNSWRLTRPLRAARAVVRKAKR